MLAFLRVIQPGYFIEFQNTAHGDSAAHFRLAPMLLGSLTPAALRQELSVPALCRQSPSSLCHCVRPLSTLDVCLVFSLSYLFLLLGS